MRSLKSLPIVAALSLLTVSLSHAQQRTDVMTRSADTAARMLWSDALAQRYAVMLGVGYVNGQVVPPAPAALLRWQRASRILQTQAALRELARQRPATRCPMPIAKADTSRLSPMQVVVPDSLRGVTYPPAGSVIGCVNSLER